MADRSIRRWTYLVAASIIFQMMILQLSFYLCRGVVRRMLFCLSTRKMDQRKSTARFQWRLEQKWSIVSKVVPISGKFENAKAFLMHIAETVGAGDSVLVY